MPRLVLLLGASLLCMAGPALGAGPSADEQIFGPFRVGGDHAEQIILNGPINNGAALNFRRALSAAPSAKTVTLNSPGGLVDIGLLIADDVHQRHLDTIVPAGSGCYSACSLVFFAGASHTAIGQLGVHQIASDTADLSSAQVTISDILDVMNRFGTPPDVLTIMFRTPPQDMHIFTTDEIEQFHINTGPGGSRVVAAPAPQSTSPASTAVVIAPAVASTVPVEAPAKPPVAPDLCSAFPERYFSAWSKDNVTAMAYVQSVYAPEILFYGKSITRDELVAEKLRFVTRWPRRSYTVTMLNQPSVEGGRCAVSGVVAWEAERGDPVKVSTGSATFTLVLALDGPLQIVGETGHVIRPSAN